MARPRSTIPTYRKNSATGRAAVSFYRADGTRTEVILPGKYGSTESKAEYERLLSQLRANDGRMPTDHRQDLSIDELVLKFLEHAKSYYVDPVSKEPTKEVGVCSDAFRPLCRLYGNTSASEFGPVALQTLRTVMTTGSWMTDKERASREKSKRHLGLARTTTNKQINRVKLVFKWASSNELIPASVHHGLATVGGLRRGRSAARETEPVKPISTAIVEDTLPHLPPIVCDVVQILLLTGMRCGEAVIMRASDLDMTGDIWLYRPERHKGLWRGKERVIAIGPRAQAIIRKYLGLRIDAYLFSPAAQEELIQAERRENRKTPLYPSHAKRLAEKRKANGKRRPGERFEVGGINRAIRQTCKRVGIERWHTHQLRHSASLAFSREMGLEHARAALGHSSVDMSAMYAGHDVEAAKDVARKIG